MSRLCLEKNHTQKSVFLYFCFKKVCPSDLDTHATQLNTAETTTLRALYKNLQTEMKINFTEDESNALFSSAKAYADSNEEAHLKIHMRFLEIADRALNTNAKIAIEANRMSSDALQEWVASKSGGTVIAESPFATVKRNVDLFGVDTGLALADAKELKKVAKMVASKHKTQIKGPFKRQNALEFFKIAKESLDQPDYSYCIAKQAAALAGDKKVEDISLMMQVAKFLAEKFAGQDYRSLQFELLKSSRSKLAKLALTLLDNPDDNKANALVGLSYCLLSDNWKEGLSMLARSGDKELEALCQMEQSVSKISREQRQIGDAWYELKKNKAYKRKKTKTIEGL